MTDQAGRLAAALADRYRIEHPLGEGGMATVYLAHDVRHDRKVAVKVLRPELAAVVGAERFLREIKTTANLQHPNILPLFDSGRAVARPANDVAADTEGQVFLYYVMPYVQGETLRDRLNREKQLGVDEAVRITAEVAYALDYAHRQHVIHRDIKPENILLHDGRPLVADFGVALAVSAAAGPRMTETGLSVGTPHYMSPEQAAAEKDLTSRSDIYSLGAVLYEMLTGSPPHSGSTVQQIVMRVVTEEAKPVTALRKSVPPHVAAAVAKCLEKVPADRFDTAARVASALTDARAMPEEAVAAYPSASGAGLPRRARLGRWAWRMGLAAAGIAVGWLLRPTAATVEPPVTRFSIPVPDGHMMSQFLRTNLDVSADGRQVTYFSDAVLYRRSLDRGDPEPLGTFPNMCCPQFSPDGQWIVFGNTLTDTSIRGVSVDGGPMVDVSAQLRDADLVAGSAFERGGIRRRRPGGVWQPITHLAGSNEGAHVLPQLLPGKADVLYTVLGPSGMWHGARVVVERLATGERVTIAEGVTDGRYIPTGHVLYVDVNGTLHAVPFDVSERSVRGAPFVVDTGIRTAYWGGAGSYAVSDAGTLAFVRGSNWENHRLTWLDRRGEVLERVGRPATIEGVRISPDGRYAVTYVASANSDISLFDLETGEDRRLTFDPETEDNPVWSGDGRRIAYRRVVSGREHRILIRDVTGQDTAQHVYTADRFTAPRSWSPDGRALALVQGTSLLILDLETGEVDTVTTSVASEGGRFSPNGRWLAYAARETDTYEVYVVSYPALGAKQQVSLRGGRMPEWSVQSDELFFVEAATVMVTDVETGDSFTRSTPRPLFASPDFERGVLWWYGVSPDGRRILYPAPNPGAPAREIHVVLNWFQELAESAER